MLRRLVTHLRTILAHDFEILVVDDSDAAMQTAMATEIANLREELGADIDLRLFPGPRRGKGAAVRAGVRHARGSIVFLLDADVPVLLGHIEEFLETMRTTGADIVVGERARDRYAHDPSRRVLANGLRFIQRTFVFHGANFEDTQCGFKAFLAGPLRHLAERQVVEGGMFDLEYLYAAAKGHLRVERVHVTSSEEVRPSRIRLWRCAFFDPLDILRLKWAGVLGRYAR